MKIRSFFLLVGLVVIFAGIGGIGSYFLFSDEDRSGNTVVDNAFGWKYPVALFPKVGPNLNEQLAYSDIRDPGGIPEGLPVRLKIPAIGVDSAIEDAFITPDGRMDVPSGSVNVAWFALGPHPGKVGSAVIGGHFGINNGVKFVFYDLDKLNVGDKVYIEDDTGATLAFVVRKISLFDRNADATTVFTSDDGLAHLNLITCEGLWNQVNDTYPDRRVVFTDAIPSEGPIVVNNPAIVANPIPNPDQLPKVVPNTTTSQDSNVTPDAANSSPGTSQVLVASAKSLYATPLDGLITSFLLISIAFVGYKINRRGHAYR